MFLILMLALLVIGPERLPGAARSLGRWVGKARRYVEGVRYEVEQEFDIKEFKKVLRDQESQISELKQQLSSTLDAEQLAQAAKFQNHEDESLAEDAASEKVGDSAKKD